jgi:hypothetical protein
VPADLRAAVTEGLHQADLAAFRRDDACQHHVGKEGGDYQEDGRQDARHGAELVDLVHQEPVRQLVGAGNGTAAAIAGQ